MWMNVHVELTIAMQMQIVEIQLGVLRVCAGQGLQETEEHARVSIEILKTLQLKNPIVL